MEPNIHRYANNQNYGAYYESKQNKIYALLRQPARCNSEATIKITTIIKSADDNNSYTINTNIRAINKYFSYLVPDKCPRDSLEQRRELALNAHACVPSQPTRPKPPSKFRPINIFRRITFRRGMHARLHYMYCRATMKRTRCPFIEHSAVASKKMKSFAHRRRNHHLCPSCKSTRTCSI